MKECAPKTNKLARCQLNFDLKPQESKHLMSSGPLYSHKPFKPVSTVLTSFGASTTVNKSNRQRPRNVLLDNEDPKPLASDKQLKSVCEDLSNQSLSKNSLRQFLSGRFDANNSKSIDGKIQSTNEGTRRKFEISQSSRSIDSDTQIRSILKTSTSVSAEKKHVKIDESRNVLHMIEGRLKPDDFQASLRKNLDFNVPNLYNMFLNNSLSDENAQN